MELAVGFESVAQYSCRITSAQQTKEIFARSVVVSEFVW
jgi:hypothetical protein